MKYEYNLVTLAGSITGIACVPEKDLIAVTDANSVNIYAQNTQGAPVRVFEKTDMEVAFSGNKYGWNIKWHTQPPKCS